MSDQWLYSQQGHQYGPVSAERIKELADSGHLHPTDLLWTAGMAKWIPADGVKGLFSHEPKPDPVANEARSAEDNPLSMLAAASQPTNHREKPPRQKDSSKTREKRQDIATRSSVESAQDSTGYSIGTKIVFGTVGLACLGMLFLAHPDNA